MYLDRFRLDGPCIDGGQFHGLLTKLDFASHDPRHVEKIVDQVIRRFAESAVQNRVDEIVTRVAERLVRAEIERIKSSIT